MYKKVKGDIISLCYLSIIRFPIFLLCPLMLLHKYSFESFRDMSLRIMICLFTPIIEISGSRHI